MENSELNTLEPEKKPPFAKASLQTGLFIAVGLLLLSIITYLLNLATASWVGWIGYVIILAGIIFGIKNFRDEYCGGFISYGRALGFGTLTSLFAALIAAVFAFFFYKYLAPDVIVQMREAAELKMLEMDPNMPDQQINMALRFVSPLVLALGSIFAYFFFGFIFSLIASIFLKKQEDIAF